MSGYFDDMIFPFCQQIIPNKEPTYVKQLPLKTVTMAQICPMNPIPTSPPASVPISSSYTDLGGSLLTSAAAGKLSFSVWFYYTYTGRIYHTILYLRRGAPTTGAPTNTLLHLYTTYNGG